jgi:hypothetical protein
VSSVVRNPNKMYETRILGMSVGLRLLPLLFPCGGCCLTGHLCKDVSRGRLKQLQSVSTDWEGNRWLLLRCKGGRTYRLSAELAPSAASVEIVDPHRVADLSDSSAWRAWLAQERNGRHYVAVRGPGEFRELECPNPIRWSNPDPYLRALVMPIAFTLDVLVSAPLQFWWAVWTARGHRDPFPPWCGKSSEFLSDDVGGFVASARSASSAVLGRVP